MTDPRPEPRIIRFNRWASAVALILGILLMLATLISLLWVGTALGRLAARIDTDTTTPGPLVTGCPFGEQECGG